MKARSVAFVLVLWDRAHSTAHAFEHRESIGITEDGRTQYSQHSCDAGTFTTEPHWSGVDVRHLITIKLGLPSSDPVAVVEVANG